MAGGRSRWTSCAVLSVVTAAGMASSITDTCCGMTDASTCCPRPSIADDAANFGLPDEKKLRIVNDPERCCSNWSAVGCMAYGVAGCSFCRDVCDESDDTCVPCPVANGAGAYLAPPTPGPSPSKLRDEHGDISYDSVEEMDDMWDIFTRDEDAGEDRRSASFSFTEDADDESGVLGHLDDDSRDEIEFKRTPGSYDFSDDPEQHDCSACAWDRMSRLEQRLLTQRSRSMVCDSSCLHNSGDAHFGVTLCNYFNTGKACRACCHEGHMIEGCMPCEGRGSCDSCISNILQICKERPCEPECQAYVCCSVQWGEYSGCEERMHHEMAELAAKVSDQCNMMLTCEDLSLSCSDNARTCAASSTTNNRRLQEETFRRCRVLKVTGAGRFNSRYASTGEFGDELIFSAVGSKNLALESVSVDACAGMDKVPYINAASADVIVARSGLGFLAWDDGAEPNMHVINTGVGCPRHMWFLRGTEGEQGSVLVTVDESEHPQFVSSDWVEISAGGQITRIDLDLSCTEEQAGSVKF